MSGRFPRALLGYAPQATEALLAAEASGRQQRKAERSKRVQELVTERLVALERLREVEGAIRQQQEVQHALLRKIEGVTGQVAGVIRHAVTSFEGDETRAVIALTRVQSELGRWQQTVQEAREGLALWVSHFGGLMDDGRQTGG